MYGGSYEYAAQQPAPLSTATRRHDRSTVNRALVDMDGELDRVMGMMSAVSMGGRATSGPASRAARAPSQDTHVAARREWRREALDRLEASQADRRQQWTLSSDRWPGRGEQAQTSSARPADRIRKSHHMKVYGDLWDSLRK